MAEPNVDEETQKVDEELVKAGDKHPETVPWNQYVGIKQSLGKKLDTATQKVGTLEEQLKGTIGKEEHDKIKTELETAKASQKTADDALAASKSASLTEKRDVLTKKGVPEDKVKDMSVEQLDGLLGVIANLKPGADMGGGGGGGGGEIKGSPMELARQAYASSNKK